MRLVIFLMHNNRRSNFRLYLKSTTFSCRGGLSGRLGNNDDVIVKFIFTQLSQCYRDDTNCETPNHWQEMQMMTSCARYWFGSHHNFLSFSISQHGKVDGDLCPTNSDKAWTGMSDNGYFSQLQDGRAISFHRPLWFRKIMCMCPRVPGSEKNLPISTLWSCVKSKVGQFRPTLWHRCCHSQGCFLCLLLCFEIVLCPAHAHPFYLASLGACQHCMSSFWSWTS